jgi:hypothetical protein
MLVLFGDGAIAQFKLLEAADFTAVSIVRASFITFYILSTRKLYSGVKGLWTGVDVGHFDERRGVRRSLEPRYFNFHIHALLTTFLSFCN